MQYNAPTMQKKTSHNNHNKTLIWGKNLIQNHAKNNNQTNKYSALQQCHCTSVTK